jgi:hypothetical protein
MIELRWRPLFRLEIELHPIQEIGHTPMGVRRVFPVAGGSFTGDRLKGRVLPHGGADWLLARADGAFQQDVRMALETDDGALILMSYRGVRHAGAEVAARLSRGGAVARNDYYLRTAPFFETAAENYAGLNRIVTVAMGERLPTGAVAYDMFEIL